MSTSGPPDTGKAVPSVPANISRWNSYLDQISATKGDEGNDFDLVDEGGVKPGSTWATALFRKPANYPRGPNAIATRRSVFDDPRLAPFYWPKQEYENIHRFDPSARWTYAEEKALLRKVDWKIMAIVAVGCFTLQLDRSNLNQANSASFLSDLRLTTDDFNTGNTIFRVCWLLAELPSQVISKRVGSDIWIPVQICLWSIVSLSQFWLRGRASFLICRALLGLFQGGLIPDMVLYMSYFYSKTELPIRLAGFWICSDTTGIVGSFMAFGIFHLGGVGGKAGWRWLFLIEGLITLAIGVASFFGMPASPTQTKTWFRPKGWFTEREEIIMVNKVLRDDPTKSDMHNREGLSLGQFWMALVDYDMWPMYIIGFVTPIPAVPLSAYLTLLLRHAGFDTFTTNLLTIPSQALAIISMFLITVVSEYVDERIFVSMIENLWMLPFLVALYALPSSPNPWLFFGIVTGLLSFPFTPPIQTAWCSRNSGAVANRTVNASLYNMFAQAGIIVGTQLYVASDAPRYERGNRNLIILCSINVFLLYPAAKAYYVWRNRRRARIWDAMTPEEKVRYLNTTKDVANKRLDFQFAH